MTTTYHTVGQVADELKRRLALCRTADGYATDLGAKINDGHRQVHGTDVPCCSLIEGDDVPARVKSRTIYAIDQRFAILAYVPCDDLDPNVAARAAVRDIKRAIFSTDGKDDPDLGGKARDVTYLGKQIAARADGANFVLVVVEISVEFVENLSTP